MYGEPKRCKRGHIMEGYNLQPNGDRGFRCRACRKIASDAYYRRRGLKTASERRAERAARDERILDLYAQGVSRREIANLIPCCLDVVTAALNPKYREQRRLWARDQARKRRARSSLQQRHAAAMQIVHSLSVGERYQLLAAVVWPESETLRNMEEAA